MERTTTFRLFVVLPLLSALGGCEWFGQSEQSADIPIQSEEIDQSELANLEAPVEGELKLNLEVGQRFPLLKTVQQTLDQEQGDGIITSTSRLELLLALEVEEIQPTRKRFGVRYQRVSYAHDIAGEKVFFDSATPNNTVPPAALPYLGLIDNGFSFWLGEDNKMTELVGFQEFLRRCLRNIPQEQQYEVMKTLAATTGEEGIANFVDDAIGLLPNRVDENGKTAVSVGDKWTTERNIPRPLPIRVTNTCTLQELNNDVARIDVAGTIVPSATYARSPASDDEIKLHVRGGRCFGSCTIDRTTGLPRKSEMERFLDMSVELRDGRQLAQHKTIKTTITTFLQQSASGPDSGGVVPASAEVPGNSEPRRLSELPTSAVPVR